MSFRIRQAAPHDLAALLQLDRAIGEAAHWSEAEYRRMIEGTAPAAAGVGSLILVALGEAPAGAPPVVGMVAVKAVAGEWEVENVAVLPSVRRRGAGRLLLGEVIRRAAAQEVSAIFLEVRESNVPARKLYEGLGFRVAGRRINYYQHPPEDAVLYDFRLTR